MTWFSIIMKADELRERMQRDRRDAIARHHDSERTGIVIKEIDEK